MNRPTSVTVFGILNLLFAVLGLVGAFISALMFLLPQPQGLKNPMLDLIHKNDAYATFAKVSMIVGVAAAIVLALAGAGLLLMKPGSTPPTSE